MHYSSGVPSRIEDYALIGDCQTAALVSRSGSIDWLCLPRFDSGACFAALLGGPEHGRWTLAPKGRVHRVTRAYRDGTLVLDTTFECDGGTAILTDFMPLRERVPHLVRIVRCTRGHVRMATQLVIRFDYGSIVPWVRRQGEGPGRDRRPRLAAHPERSPPARGELHDRRRVRSARRTGGGALGHVAPVAREGSRSNRRADAAPRRGARLACLVEPLHLRGPLARSSPSLAGDPQGADARPDRWHHRRADHLAAGVPRRRAELGLPLHVGAGRDLHAARAHRERLHRGGPGLARLAAPRHRRAIPPKMQILYGVDGYRRVEERQIDWLPGYEGARPVRVGNAAHEQRQLDVFGEIMDAMHQARLRGFPPDPHAWGIGRALLEHLETCWADADDGIWEMRGPQRQFTHSKMMTWVAFDRAVKRMQQRRRGGTARTLECAARSHPRRRVPPRLRRERGRLRAVLRL